MRLRRVATLVVLLAGLGAAAYGGLIAYVRRTSPVALERAALHLHNGEPVRSREALKWVLWADPNHSGAWHLMGMSYLSEQDFAAAIDSLEKVSEDSERGEEARVQLAAALIAARKLERVEPVLRGVLDRNPNSLVAARMLSGLFLTELRQREAIEVLERFLSASQGTLTPDERLLMLRDLATAEFHSPTAATCAPTLKEALKKDPDQPVVRLALGQCELEAGNTATGAALLKDAQRRRPTDPRIRLVYAAYLLEAGEIDAAEAQLRPEITAGLEADDRVRDLQSRLAEARGDFDQALQHAERAITLRPHVKEYEARRAPRLLQRLGRGDEAGRAYARVEKLGSAELDLFTLSRDLGAADPR